MVYFTSSCHFVFPLLLHFVLICFVGAFIYINISSVLFTFLFCFALLYCLLYFGITLLLPSGSKRVKHTLSHSLTRTERGRGDRENVQCCMNKYNFHTCQIQCIFYNSHLYFTRGGIPVHCIINTSRITHADTGTRN